MPRYVLLRHECPTEYREGPHWDLMLERPATADERRLATWSLLTLPLCWAAALAVAAPSARHDEVDAEALADHRAHYLDYEGPLSGSRGSVRRVASGELVWRCATADRIDVAFSDGPLAGECVLTRGDINRWRLRATLASGAGAANADLYKS